jgi:hypothetical protein
MAACETKKRPETGASDSRARRRKFLLIGASVFVLLSDTPLIRMPAAHDTTTKISQSTLKAERKPEPPEEINEEAALEKIGYLNWEFEENYKLLTDHMRKGGAQRIYSKIYKEEAECGGYVAINRHPKPVVDFVFVKDQLRGMLDDAIEAIQNERPIPDPSELINFVNKYAGVEDLPDVAQKYPMIVGKYERLRTIQRNEVADRDFEESKTENVWLLKTIRKGVFKSGWLIDRKDYVFSWHHHPMSEVPAPASDKDIANTAVFAPEIVLEVKKNEIILHAVVSNHVAHVERFAGLKDE